MEVYNATNNYVDTTLFCNFDHTQNEFTINNELDHVYRWLCSNKLSLNVSETKHNCFHTPKRKVIFPDLKFNNITFDRVSDFKFLGCFISSNLKCKKHIIDHISVIVFKVIGIMFLLKYILPCDVLHVYTIV